MKSIQRSLSLSALCAVAFLPLHAALACSPPPDSWMLAGTLPADETMAVPIDQPLVIVTQTFASPLSEADLDEMTLELVGPDGVPVEGALRLAPFGELIVFEPTEPLRPSTKYAWTVTQPSPWGGDQREEQTFDFETGEARFEVEPGAALADLEFLPQVETVFGECDPNGGFDSCGGCQLLEVGQVSVIRARAHVDMGTRASQAFGVRIGLGATPEEAEVVAARASLQPLPARPDGTADLEAGRAEARTWGADQACVSLVVVDLLERTWLEASTCARLPAWLPVDPEAPVDPETTDADAEVDGSSGGCNTRGTAFAPLLGLLLPFGLLRRRALSRLLKEQPARARTARRNHRGIGKAE